MTEYIEAIVWCFVVLGLMILFIFIGSQIGRQNTVNELCNKTQYDFCVPKIEYTIKGE